MNQGGEQGHDDYGLPPVDIEIPDDARELSRDVQAYHRELRALRRHQRSMRWRAPFRRSGVAIPLLAGCLIVALVAVMISAMLTTNPYLPPDQPTRQPTAGTSYSTTRNSPSHSAAASATSPAGGTSAGKTTAKTRLPGKTISVAGKPRPLRALRSTALAIVPANCGCDTAVRQLLIQARHAGILVYLVSPRGTSAAALSRLASLASGTKTTRVATDQGNVLTAAFNPVGFTVLLVDAHGLVTVDEGLNNRLMLEKQLALLKSPS